MRVTKLSIGLILSVVMGVINADVGQIKKLSGDVRILRDGMEFAAAPGDLVEQADTLLTGDDSRVGITFIDNTRFRPNRTPCSSYQCFDLTRRLTRVRSQGKSAKGLSR